MQALIDRIDFSTDDSFWTRQADFEDLEAFANDPRTWMENEWSKIGVCGSLTDSFMIKLGKHERSEVPFLIRGTAHVMEEGRVSSLIEVALNERFVAYDWSDVAREFPNPHDATITYNKDHDLTTGGVKFHMEMAPDLKKLLVLHNAIQEHPDGYPNWLASQNIINERWVLPGGTAFEDITRPNGGNPNTLVTFNSTGPLSVIMITYTPEEGRSSYSCNSNFGVYYGNPELNANTDLDINSVELKMY